MINSPPFSKLSVELETYIKNDWMCIRETWIYIDYRRATQASYKWSKPSTGKLKCNVDTTCYTDNNSFDMLYIIIYRVLLTSASDELVKEFKSSKFYIKKIYRCKRCNIVWHLPNLYF
jgi:hypothetical protein